MDGAGKMALALKLANISQVDDDQILIADLLGEHGRRNELDLCIRLIEKGLVADSVTYRH